MIRAGAIAIALAIAACGPKVVPAPREAPPVPLQLERPCDLAPAAGLVWMVEAKPRAIAERADLIPAIALVIPEARFGQFAETNGGIDLRQIQDLCVAEYRETRLSVARTPLDPARVEKAFSERVTKGFGRQIDVPNPRVVRLSGEVGGESQQLVVFGRDVAALEQGRPGPVRAAEAFALGKLRRASPALRGPALAHAAQLLGDAPVRAFAPGPFEGDAARGLGGLLRASTAMAAAARFSGPTIEFRWVVMGAWGHDAPEAGSRLASVVHVIEESPLGRLLGLAHPAVPSRVTTTEDALIVDMSVDAMTFARGMHDALDASVMEILRLGSAR